MNDVKRYVLEGTCFITGHILNRSNQVYFRGFIFLGLKKIQQGDKQWRNETAVLTRWRYFWEVLHSKSYHLFEFFQRRSGTASFDLVETVLGALYSK